MLGLGPEVTKMNEWNELLNMVLNGEASIDELIALAEEIIAR